MPLFYPVALNLHRRLCVVVGGGPIAEQKVVGLLGAGARVTVVAPVLTTRLDDLEAQGAIQVMRRPYRRGDLRDAFPLTGPLGPSTLPVG